MHNIWDIKGEDRPVFFAPSTVSLYLFLLTFGLFLRSDLPYKSLRHMKELYSATVLSIRLIPYSMATGSFLKVSRIDKLPMKEQCKVTVQPHRRGYSLIILRRRIQQNSKRKAAFRKANSITIDSLKNHIS